MKLSFLSCYKCEALQEKLSCPLSLHPRKFPCQKCRWNKKAIHSHFFLQSLRSQKLAAMPQTAGIGGCHPLSLQLAMCPTSAALEQKIETFKLPTKPKVDALGTVRLESISSRAT